MLVIGLGIAILVVIAAMIGMAVRNAWRKDAGTQVIQAQEVILKPGEVPELNFDLDPGATIADARMDGSVLIIRVTAPSGDQVLVVDPARSRVLSRIRFNRKPAETVAPPARP
jgi:hypothetical protein